MIDVKRTFIPGDQWLYFKIYTGFKTAELLLAEAIAPIANQLLSNQIINKWFFIRYSDPELHLRTRFFLSDRSKIGLAIQMFNQALQWFIQNDLIWKVQIDTYQREIERYGETIIELSEYIFFYDSQYFIRIYKAIQEQNDEILRWLSALVAVDYLLNDFSFDLSQKVSFITMVKENLAREFGLENSKSQLSEKYRMHRKAVERTIEAKEYQIIHEILKERSKFQANIATQIIQNIENNEKINLLLANYTHMMMNRWFLNRQRMHEAVVYNFLFQYYTSKLARRKLELKPE